MRRDFFDGAGGRGGLHFFAVFVPVVGIGQEHGDKGGGDQNDGEEVGMLFYQDEDDSQHDVEHDVKGFCLGLADDGDVTLVIFLDHIPNGLAQLGLLLVDVSGAKIVDSEDHADHSGIV